jgi:CBS domain-containing membrane protein
VNVGGLGEGKESEVKVKELMQTSVATVRASDSLTQVDELMKAGWVRHLPVVDATNRVLGVITQRDLLRASPSLATWTDPKEQQRWLEQVLVRDVMTKKPSTIEPYAEITEALDTLLAGKFGCLPVVEGGKLIGLVTETDLLRHLQTLLRKKSGNPSVIAVAKKRLRSSK